MIARVKFVMSCGDTYKSPCILLSSHKVNNFLVLDTTALVVYFKYSVLPAAAATSCKLDSENAGLHNVLEYFQHAKVFHIHHLCFFHSSPSSVTIFFP